MKNIAVFSSGGGSNFRSIHRHIQSGEIPGRIVLTVSNNSGSGAIQYAKRYNIITLILNKIESDLSNLISLNLSTIGIRIPNHAFPLEIVKNINKPLITTSVNIHDKSSLLNIEAMHKEFSSINIFYDKKLKNKSQGSTILDCTADNIKILRQGEGQLIT